MTTPHIAPKVFITLALLAGAAMSAHAQSAGSVLVRAGAATIKPKTESGDLSAPSLAGTKIDVGSDTELSGGITYMLTDNLSVDLPVAMPFKHEIVGAGAIAGAGKIGEVKALPITLLGQYRFGAASAQVRPYLGAGLTYAKFFKESTTAALTALTGGTPGSPTTMRVASRFGATFQLGASLAINSQWSLDASYAKTLLKTKATLSTGQTIDIKLNPDSYALALGYKF